MMISNKMHSEYFTEKLKLKYRYRLGTSDVFFAEDEMGIDMTQFYEEEVANIIIADADSGEKDLPGMIFKDEKGNLVMKLIHISQKFLFTKNNISKNIIWLI